MEAGNPSSPAVTLRPNTLIVLSVTVIGMNGFTSWSFTAYCEFSQRRRDKRHKSLSPLSTNTLSDRLIVIFTS